METMNFLHKGQSGFFSLSSSSHFQSSQPARDLNVMDVDTLHNTSTHSPRRSHKENASPDASTVEQKDIWIRTVQGPPVNAKNTIGPKETIRKGAPNSERYACLRKLLIVNPTRREMAKQLELSGCSLVSLNM